MATTILRAPDRPPHADPPHPLSRQQPLSVASGFPLSKLVSSPPLNPKFKYQSWYPQNDIETDQGFEEWQTLPQYLVDYLRSPLDPGIGGPSPVYNGNVGTYFPATVGITQSLQLLTENPRRIYLAIQNQGPGNLWVQFGAAAAVNACVKLVPAQFYEPQIAGVGFHGTMVNVPIRNSVNVIADLAGTIAVVCESVWIIKGLVS